MNTITPETLESLRGWGAPYRPTRGVIFGADYTISAPRDYGGGNVHPEILNRFLRRFPLRFWRGRAVIAGGLFHRLNIERHYFYRINWVRVELQIDAS